MKAIEKPLKLILIIALLIVYPIKLAYNFIVAYMIVYISEIEALQEVAGIQNLVIIDGIAAITLGTASITCAWLLYKQHKNRKAITFSFLTATLVYYLLEPIWLQLSGFPIDTLYFQLYEKPTELLRPIGAIILFYIYFKIETIQEK